MAVDDALRPRASLGRYRLGDRIAVGGMAEIYRARAVGSRGVEKEVVIKRILPHLAKQQEFVAMFIDEARLMARLSHPKVVQVLEFGEIDGELFMALELVDGIDALGLLRACARQKTRFPPPLALFIVSEVLDALEYVHSVTGPNGVPLEVVHRDISPSNILIARRGYVKVGDFGVARVIADARIARTEGTSLKGKYGYMAPEQVIGNPLDRRADVFAAGVVLSEMLIGRRLFSAPTDLGVLLMVRDANLERLERYGGGLAPELRELVLRALARSPADRYSTAGEFRDAVLDQMLRLSPRAGPSELARFLEVVFSRPGTTPSPEMEGVLDGPQTKAARAEANRMHSRMRAEALDPRLAHPSSEERREVEEAVEQALRESTPVTPVDGAELVGDLGVTSPTRLMSRLAADRETGLLVLDSDGVTKEIYFVSGIPEYVTSNAPNERLGRYLVGQKVLKLEELSTVLALLPRFKGKIGDTLVGLGMMRPLDVLRHLSRQVRDKLIDVFSWREGAYRYYRGRTSTGEIFPLRLDPFEIIGAGVTALPPEQVRQQLARDGAKRLRRVERSHPQPEDFKLGKTPREIWQRLDGQRTVVELLGAGLEHDEQARFDRMLYLLVETGLASAD